MRLFISCSLILAFALTTAEPSHATTDEANVTSIYFTQEVAFSGSSMGFSTFETYAGLWRRWLQVHRAIEKERSLPRQLSRLPGEYHDRRSKALKLIHKHLPRRSIVAQPTHVYILQLGIYESRRGVANFLRSYWPKVAAKNIYEKTPKSFRIGQESEYSWKSQPIFVLPSQFNGKPCLRLCHGAYASPADAARDAKQFVRYLGYSPALLKRPFTAKLARRLYAEPVAGQMLQGATLD